MSMGPLWTPRGSLVTSDLLGKNQHKFFTVCGKKTTHSRCLELTWPMAVILAHDKTVPQRVQGLPADCDSAGLPGPACVLAEPASVRGDGAPSCKQRGMSSRNSRGRQCLFKRQMERMLEENLVEFSCMLSHFSHVRLCDPMDCSLPGASVHGVLQARMASYRSEQYHQFVLLPLRG